MCPQKWKASAFCVLIAPSTKPPPATPSSNRPVRARKPRREVAPATASLNTQRRRPEQRFQLVERVEGALAEHLAVRREHDRVWAAGDGERLPGLGSPCSSKSRSSTSGSRASSRSDGSRAAQSEQPGEVKTATASGARPLEALDQPDAPAELGAFVVERESGLWGDREPQLADLAGQGEQCDGQRCHAHERDRQSGAEPGLGRRRGVGRNGSTANPAARHAERTPRPSRSANCSRSSRRADRLARVRSRLRARG